MRLGFRRGLQQAGGHPPVLPPINCLLVAFGHSDEVTMPTVVPDVAAAAMNAQHPLDLAVVQEVKRIVAVERIGSAGCPA